MTNNNRTTGHGQARARASRPKRLEPKESFHRLDRRRPHAQGARRRGKQAARSQPQGSRSTSRSRRCSCALSARSGSCSTKCSSCGFRSRTVALQRASLRRAAGPRQSADHGEARRGAGEDLAAQLRHSAAAARGPTSAIRGTIRAMRRFTPSVLPATESLEDDARARTAILGGPHRAGNLARAQRARRRARQQLTRRS